MRDTLDEPTNSVMRALYKLFFSRYPVYNTPIILVCIYISPRECKQIYFLSRAQKPQTRFGFYSRIYARDTQMTNQTHDEHRFTVILVTNRARIPHCARVEISVSVWRIRRIRDRERATIMDVMN